MQEIKPKQIKAIHPYIKWCRQVVASENEYVILDTETTGLKGEIVDLAIIDTKGTVLYNSLLKPTCEISADAQALHHISKEMLEHAPTIADEWVRICEIVGTREVITYGSVFDSERIDDSLNAYGLAGCEWLFVCAMRRYSNFWNAPPRWNGANAPYQKLGVACNQQGITLPPGLHRALADCQATFSLICKVAETGNESPTYRTSAKKEEK